MDIETAPTLGYTWGVYETNVIEVIRPWFILSFAAKWLHDKRIQTFCLPDYDGYEKDKENDRWLCEDLWRLLDEADIVVAHNGDRFDLRKVAARFLAHNLRPPSPYRTVDTLKLAKKHFAFDSNKLDNLSGDLGLGRKLAHTGKHLWLRCMSGDSKAWAKMRRYNGHDVYPLLEKLYLRIRPWATNHPNLSHYTRQADSCPVCQSPKTNKSGFKYHRTGKRQEHRCMDCGHRFVAGPLIRLT